jgi:hypothetical protein
VQTDISTARYAAQTAPHSCYIYDKYQHLMTSCTASHKPRLVQRHKCRRDKMPIHNVVSIAQHDCCVVCRKAVDKRLSHGKHEIRQIEQCYLIPTAHTSHPYIQICKREIRDKATCCGIDKAQGCTECTHQSQVNVDY